MLNVKTPQQVDQMKAEADSIRAEEIDMLDADDSNMSVLAGIIKRDWSRAKDNKTIVEQDMLECLRERKGEYSPEDLANIEGTGSTIYIKTAMSKIRSGIAHMKSIYMSEGDKPYGIDATPNPSLSPDLEDRIYNHIAENPNLIGEDGQEIDVIEQANMLERMVKQEMFKESKRAAENMERLIDDQLAEGEFDRALNDLIDDVNTYPACFVKGPFNTVKPVMSWERTSEGYKPKTEFKIVKSFRSINPFDAYPAPGVDSVHKGAFIERIRFNISDLARFKGQPGYDDDQINEVIRVYGRGGLRNWLWTDSVRHDISNHTFFWMKQTTDIDALHWYGRASGMDLLDWGMDERLIPDLMDEYEVDAILVGSYVIRAVINPDPLYRRPIHSTAFEKIPGNVFGNSPSMLCRSSTKIINACARALQNNMAHASGFQTEIDYERLHEETDPFDIHPFKVWQARESEVTTTASAAVRFFQPDSNAAEMLNVMSAFEEKADKDTGIPEFFHGGQGGGEGADATARGREMLMNQSMKLLRSSIINIDVDILQPMLRMLYDDNMLNHEDNTIKGDAQVVPRGASAMLQRDSIRNDHMAFLELTANPVDLEIMGQEGRSKILRSLAKTYPDLPNPIPSEEEREMAARTAEQQGSPEELQAQIEAQQAQQIQQAQAEKDAQELASRSATEQAKINAQRSTELAKLRAARELEKVKQDAENVRHEAKLRNEARIEQGRQRNQLVIAKSTQDMATKQANEASRTELQRQSDAGVQLTTADVESVVAQQVAKLSTDFTSAFEAIKKDITENPRGDESTGHNFNITVDMGCGDKKKKTKQFSTKRDKDGNLQGTIVEGSE